MKDVVKDTDITHTEAAEVTSGYITSMKARPGGPLNEEGHQRVISAPPSPLPSCFSCPFSLEQITGNARFQLRRFHCRFCCCRDLMRKRIRRLATFLRVTTRGFNFLTPFWLNFCHCPPPIFYLKNPSRLP